MSASCDCSADSLSSVPGWSVGMKPLFGQVVDEPAQLVARVLALLYERDGSLPQEALLTDREDAAGEQDDGKPARARVVEQLLDCCECVGPGLWEVEHEHVGLARCDQRERVEAIR